MDFLRRVTVGLATATAIAAPAVSIGAPTVDNLLFLDRTSGSSLSQLIPLECIESAVSSGSFVNTSGIAAGPGGAIYVSDPRPGNPSGAAIMRVDPTSGVASVVSEGGQLRSVDRLVVGTDGMIYVMDKSAASGKSAIIRIDPTTGTQVMRMSDYPGCFLIAARPDGKLIVSDGTNLILVDPSSWNSYSLHSPPANSVIDAIAALPNSDCLVLGCMPCDAYATPSLSRIAAGGSLLWQRTLVGLPTEVHPTTHGGMQIEPYGHVLFSAEEDVYGASHSEFYDANINTPGCPSACGSDTYNVTLCWQGARGSTASDVAIYGVSGGVVPARTVSWGQVKHIYR